MPIAPTRKVQAGWYTVSHGEKDICGFQNEHVDFCKIGTYRGTPTWRVSTRKGFKKTDFDTRWGEFSAWDDAERFARDLALWLEGEGPSPDNQAPKYDQYMARWEAAQDKKHNDLLARLDAGIAHVNTVLDGMV